MGLTYLRGSRMTDDEPSRSPLVTVGQLHWNEVALRKTSREVVANGPRAFASP